MRFVLDDDRAYRNFQFLWGALHRSALRPTLAQVWLAHGIVDKLALLSIDKDGGRVLVAECVLHLSQEEVDFALMAIYSTAWAIEESLVKDLILWLGVPHDLGASTNPDPGEMLGVRPEALAPHDGVEDDQGRTRGPSTL